MCPQKNVIKAEILRQLGSQVEKVELESRRFGDRVFHHLPVEEGEAVGLPSAGSESSPAEETIPGELEIERFYDDQGVLTALRLRCRCGEVIELEFTTE